MEFEFTLKFMLAASAPDADALVELLGAVGCNDALIGIGPIGVINPLPRMLPHAN